MSYKDDDFKGAFGEEEEEEEALPDLGSDFEDALDDDFSAIVPDEEGFEEEFSADEDSML